MHLSNFSSVEAAFNQSLPCSIKKTRVNQVLIESLNDIKHVVLLLTSTHINMQ